MKPALVSLLPLCCVTFAGAAAVDLSGYDRRCGVDVNRNGRALVVRWSAGEEADEVTFDTSGTGPLLSRLAAATTGRAPVTLAESVQPQYSVTVGSRRMLPIERYVFFDNPSKRPHETHQGRLELKSVRVVSEESRASVVFSTYSAGPFRGDMTFTFYAGSPLVYVEAAMAQPKREVAYAYDALLLGNFSIFAWKGIDHVMHQAAPAGPMAPVTVRSRTIMAESKNGTVAVFPPPHAFFFPRDLTNNLGFAQAGKEGFGLRQDTTGGGAFVPWFDAPPDKPQHMGMFLLLSTQNAERTLERVKRYTHGDSLKQLDGYQTFTSHWHSRLTVNEMAGTSRVDEFARVMKEMNVNIVHLAEFHGDGHPDDPGPLRLPEMKAMFDLCRAHSDDRLLLIPGEEGNKYLGHPWPPAKNVHPGHWMYLFPRPIYLTWVRGAGQPFEEQIEPYGTVYHVGSRDDMVTLLEREHGLAWTTHPRIKASYATPDAFKDQDFYKSDLFLGAAWKAMPADLSDDRLGRRALDLLDDMNNWGQRKLMPGEVDVFEINGTHELYGHMNINYLRLPKVPSFADWSRVLRALRSGDFFVTTGEVLIHDFDVKEGQASVDVEWTFPLQFAEVIAGDGKAVHRNRLPLTGTREFGRHRFTWPVDLSGAKWYRLEVWDVARNGVFTQPVWVR